MSERPVLYSFRRCPYAMRARMGLAAAGIEVDLREVELRDKPEDMLDVSPKGTVPVLVLPDGRVLEESLDVIDWALAVNDADGLLANQPEAQRTLVDDMDTNFKPHLDRYKYPNRYADEAGEEDHRAIGMRWIETHLAARLAAQDNLFGQAVSFADIATFPFIRQFAHVDRDWFYKAAPVAVGDWLKRHLESARFGKIMKKYKQWVPGEPGVRFPDI